MIMAKPWINLPQPLPPDPFQHNIPKINLPSQSGSGNSQVSNPIQGMLQMLMQFLQVFKNSLGS